MLRLSLFSSSCPSLRFRPVRHGEHVVFSPDARPNSPAARRRAPPPVFPPFHLALHSSLTYTLALLSFHSTRLDLAFFRGRARASVFGACAMGEPLIFGPDARPNSHAARRLAPPCRFPSVPPCPSPKTCTLPSVSFHTLGLSLFPGSCPSLRFRPVRHGEPLVFSPDARPNGPAARRRVPPCRFPSVPPCPSPKTYTLASVSFYTLGLSLFPRPWPNRCFRPARHGERLVFSPNARPNSHAARRRAPPCPSLRSSRASVSFSLRSTVPFTKDIDFMFGVFPHAST